MLEREIYKKFEDIVGKKNISEDVGICETYRCIASQSSAHYGPYAHITPRPQAVLLPKNTEEVRLITLLCNEYDIKFKASTTFWSTMGYIGSDRAIQLDMRRMKEIEIDADNQTAIVEPYAIAGAIQAEAMKFGLNVNIPGVGCSSSTLASTAGWVGAGPSTAFMGASSENLLGAEWVLPDGTVLRTGSLGAGAGWFCGEGPGPSTRAVLRGNLGSCGAMGVCTKIAVRLHPWPGPKSLESVGTVPVYKAKLPDNFKCYTLCFPDWTSWTKAVELLQENDVAYLGHRQFNMFGRNLKGAMIRIVTDPEKQLCDLPSLLEDEEIKRETESMRIEIQIVLAGMSEYDMKYKETAVEEILSITGGWKNKMMLDKDIHDWALMYLIRLGHKNLNYVMCGAYEGSCGLSNNMYVATPLMEEAAALKRKWEIEDNSIVANGGDSEMGGLSTLGGGGPLAWEFFTNFDSYDKKSVKGAREYIADSQRWMTEHKLGKDFGRVNADLRRPDAYDYEQNEQDEMYSQMPQPLIMEYQWKVREAFNPKHLGGSYYRTLTPFELREGKNSEQ